MGNGTGDAEVDLGNKFGNSPIISIQNPPRLTLMLPELYPAYNQPLTISH